MPDEPRSSPVRRRPRPPGRARLGGRLAFACGPQDAAGARVPSLFRVGRPVRCTAPTCGFGLRCMRRTEPPSSTYATCPCCDRPGGLPGVRRQSPAAVRLPGVRGHGPPAHRPRTVTQPGRALGRAGRDPATEAPGPHGPNGASRRLGLRWPVVRPGHARVIGSRRGCLREPRKADRRATSAARPSTPEVPDSVCGQRHGGTFEFNTNARGNSANGCYGMCYSVWVVGFLNAPGGAPVRVDRRADGEGGWVQGASVVRVAPGRCACGVHASVTGISASGNRARSVLHRGGCRVESVALGSLRAGKPHRRHHLFRLVGHAA